MDIFDQPPRVFDPTLLSDRTTALRDNQPVPLPNEGQARQRRIQRLQTEVSVIQAFITDCDRIKDEILMMALEYPDARNMVLANIEEMRNKAGARGKTLMNELHFLRNMQ